MSCLFTIQDILAYNCEDCESCELPFPIIADRERELAVALGMLDPDEKDKNGMPLTARCVSLQDNLRLPALSWCFISRQLVVFSFLEDVWPLIQEAPSVLVFCLGVCRSSPLPPTLSEKDPPKGEKLETPYQKFKTE